MLTAGSSPPSRRWTSLHPPSICSSLPLWNVISSVPKPVDCFLGRAGWQTYFLVVHKTSRQIRWVLLRLWLRVCSRSWCSKSRKNIQSRKQNPFTHTQGIHSKPIDPNIQNIPSPTWNFSVLTHLSGHSDVGKSQFPTLRNPGMNPQSFPFSIPSCTE